MRNFKLYSDQMPAGFLADRDPLFRTIYEESPDGIFLLNPADFTIIDCNSKAIQLFQGEFKEELCGHESFELYDNAPVEFSRNEFIDMISQGNEHTQEMAFKSLKGNVFWGKCSIRRVETAHGDVVVFRVRRVVDYMKTAEMLSVMIKQTARVTGMEYFRLLTELLGKSFGVSMVFIARIEANGKSARVLKCWHKQQDDADEVFDLETSPSLNVLRGYTSYYPNNLKEMFPEDDMVRRLDMISYMGTPVFNVEGEVCGLLVMMDNQPMEEIPNSRYMLSIFASRIGAELERIFIEESYKKKIQDLEKLVPINQ